MKTTKTLILAGLTALSIGVGTAMAQESAGGVGAGPYETMELFQARHEAALQAHNAQASADTARAPQYGSSDHVTPLVPNLEGADGNG